ncbi:SusC/RagA family TonB-linked outer membrane protein [Desertivirga xinjiangensis]|uniref:SusC/RagA family TonB-linked outer membrane protein n=1 Tax=Desertivirga xinjiangensis TaxID=539206 RepID=UPI0021097F4D|nr:TonB-dependent receptor [Pedobacter xinjiangensis]
MTQLTLSAQERTITGKVTASRDKAPLPGVTVTVKGTTTRAATDINGNFRIAAGQNDVLVFTYIGFSNKEVRVSEANGNVLNVAIQEDAAKLSEVVVVGYGTQKRSDVTGAVASVDKKRLTEVPNTNFAQALQASVPGLSVDQNAGGAEGNDNAIRIRGRNSISAETSPLIILDGVPYNGSISDINPTDIESIDVLKDASSAAIYGSRGANGVILVTTKKGTRGKPVISYDGFYGVQNLANLPNTLSPEEFYEFKKIREPNSITLSEQAVYDSKNFPDYLDLTTRQGNKMQHTLGVSGGGENSRYYVSASYLDVKGIAVNDDFKRLSSRINLETNIKSWLTFGTNTQLAYSNRDGLPATFAGQTGAYNFNPLTTPFEDDGSQRIYPWPEDVFFGNPLAATLANNEDRTSKIISNNYLDLKIPFIKGLSYRLNTGIEHTTRDVNTYYGRNTRTGLQAKGDLAMRASTNSNLLIENIVNYNHTVKKHSIAVTALYSMQTDKIRTDTLDATGFPNDVLTFYQAKVASGIIPAAGYAKQTLLSQMARINYSYDSKYLITLTGRRDGFSAFGDNNKYAFFPSVALGWNIAKEDFLKDHKIISDLKLRLSYGSNGNQAVDAYSTLAKLSTRSYVEEATSLPGYVPTSLANEDLSWETTNQLNAGVDFGLLDGRIQGSLDVYTKNTYDLLLLRAISSVHGVSKVLQNIGETSNKGLDLGVNSTNLKLKDFSWSSNLSFSFYRNKIKDLYGNGQDDIANKWFIGHPIDVNYGKIFGGVWQLTDDLSTSPQPDVKPGYAKVVDQNNDGKINDLDNVIFGSRQPDFIWGLGNNFRYKNFSLYLFFQGVQGTSRNNPLLSDNVQSGVRNNTTRKNWWSPTNPTNEYYANALGVNIHGVGILESDSYARLKDASLAYDVPAKILNQIKISRLKVYANARNLLTITKWTGTDPELNEQNSIPLQREFVFGLNIGL